MYAGDELYDDDVTSGVQAPESVRLCPACGMAAAEGDRYCDDCGSAPDRSAWVEGPAW